VFPPSRRWSDRSVQGLEPGGAGRRPWLGEWWLSNATRSHFATGLKPSPNRLMSRPRRFDGWPSARGATPKSFKDRGGSSRRPTGNGSGMASHPVLMTTSCVWWQIWRLDGVQRALPGRRYGISENAPYRLLFASSRPRRARASCSFAAPSRCSRRSPRWQLSGRCAYPRSRLQLLYPTACGRNTARSPRSRVLRRSRSKANLPFPLLTRARPIALSPTSA
jgi:hypothetical protein